MKRLCLSLFSGLLISLALFWFMQFMISNNQQGLTKTPPLQMTEFVRLKRDVTPETKDRILPDQPPPEQPPPPPPLMAMQQTQALKNTTPNLDMPNLDIPLHNSRFSGSIINGIQMGQGAISTDVIPMVRIPPRYPMNAARRHIEGWVRIEFTITETGAVKDAEVVEAQPAEVFNQAALRAIGKWKFKPKIIDGEAFEQRAVQVLQFKLSK